MWHAIKIYNYHWLYVYVSIEFAQKTAQIPWKIRSNSWENLTHYYLLTCCIVVNVKVWEKGREKQAAGQSRAPCRVMWTKCLPRDTIQPMGSTLRNSNEIICKHRKLPLQVHGKVVGESGRFVFSVTVLLDFFGFVLPLWYSIKYRYMYLFDVKQFHMVICTTTTHQDRILFYCRELCNKLQTVKETNVK